MNSQVNLLYVDHMNDTVHQTLLNLGAVVKKKYQFTAVYRFSDERSLAEAVQELDGKTIGGWPLKANPLTERPQTTYPPDWEWQCVFCPAVNLD